MTNKRVTLLAGHYGSGKTNIAVNLAFMLRKQYERVLIADLDIVNPYFRTKDSERELKDAGIDLVCSMYANTSLDIPALPQEMYRISEDKSCRAVVDVGGDDRGAVALGRLTPELLEENDFEMIYVANAYRPLTKTPAQALEVMREIERACGLPFTAVVNNSNLAGETSAKTVLDSVPFVRELCEISSLPLLFTSAQTQVCKQLEGQIPNLLELTLQKKYYDINGGI